MNVCTNSLSLCQSVPGVPQWCNVTISASWCTSRREDIQARTLYHTIYFIVRMCMLQEELHDVDYDCVLPIDVVDVVASAVT